MTELIIKIDGMACGMCEAHINDAVRRAVNVKKVTSSHKKGETVIISEDDIDTDIVKKAIEETGYKVIEAVKKPYVKKGFSSFFKK